MPSIADVIGQILTALTGALGHAAAQGQGAIQQIMDVLNNL